MMPFVLTLVTVSTTPRSWKFKVKQEITGGGVAREAPAGRAHNKSLRFLRRPRGARMTRVLATAAVLIKYGGMEVPTMLKRETRTLHRVRLYDDDNEVGVDGTDLTFAVLRRMSSGMRP